jgi:hypothetical protein
VRVYPRPDWPFKIIEENAVTDAIVTARQTWPRFEEAWDGLVWLIAHGGDRLLATERKFGGVGHYMIAYEGDLIAGFPRIALVYRWGNGAYTIRMIVVSEPES